MEITGHTGFAALLGSPVSHSISPQMHNESFRQLGLDYVYLAFDVKPENLPNMFSTLQQMNILGFNLTMPLKTAILPLLEELSPAAQLAQSVNTVYKKDNHYVGHTTDGIGYINSLKDEGIDLTGKKMTLLGAGGAATAICVQAALDKVSCIDMFKRKNQSFSTTEKFCEKVSKKTNCLVRVFDIADKQQLAKSILESAILTNATNVGMVPDTDKSIISDISMFRSDLIVSDIIYNPRKTKLLRQAEAAGCKTVNGLYMLLFQGAASFECWTGQKMPIDIIKNKYFTNERKE